MKQNKLSVILLSTIAIPILTACNSGYGQPPNLGTAIHSAKFGTMHNINSVLDKVLYAKNLTKLDEEASIDVIKQFEQLADEPASKELAKTHRKIASAINQQKFGIDPKVMEALAVSIGKMNLVDPDAQQDIAYAIYRQRFGENSRVLEALAISIGKINFTNLLAQKVIAYTIYLQSFGKDPKVMEVLAISVGKMNLVDPEAQQNIAIAINFQVFGKDPRILEALAISIGEMNFTDPEAQITIINAVVKEKLGQADSIKKYILSRYLLSMETINQAFPDNQNHFFGKLEENLVDAAKAAENKGGSIEGVYGISDAIRVIFDSKGEDNYTGKIAGSYGFIYDHTGKPLYLIVLAEKLQKTYCHNTMKDLREFLRIRHQLMPSYGSLGGNVKIFSIIQAKSWWDKTCVASVPLGQ